MSANAIDPPRSETLTLDAELARVWIDARGCIAADVACMACGYNLRTLRVAGVCPECGASVADSVRTTDLRFAPADWLERIARGVLLVLVSLVVLLGGWLVLAAVYILAESLSQAGRGPQAVPAWMLMIAYTLLGGTFSILCVRGLLLVTSRNPSDKRPRDRWAARRLLRVAAWLLPMPIAAGVAIPVVEQLLAAAARAAWLRPLDTIAMFGGAIACVVVPSLLLLHLWNLLRRSPHLRIRHWLAAEAAMLCVCGALVGGGLLVEQFAPARPLPAAIGQLNAARLRTIPYAGGVLAPSAGSTPTTAAPAGRPIHVLADTLLWVGRWGGVLVFVAFVVLLVNARRVLGEIAATAAATRAALERAASG